MTALGIHPIGIYGILPLVHDVAQCSICVKYAVVGPGPGLCLPQRTGLARKGKVIAHLSQPSVLLHPNTGHMAGNRSHYQMLSVPGQS